MSGAAWNTKKKTVEELWEELVIKKNEYYDIINTYDIQEKTMDEELYEYIGIMYKDCGIEINEIAKRNGLDVLPMLIDFDFNIDIDNKRLLVWLDNSAVIRKFEIG